MGSDRGRVLSFISYCCSWWHSSALRKHNIRRSTIKCCSFYSGLPINQSDPRQIWFELCCPAGLTIVMSGHLLTKWPNHCNFFTTYKFISSWFWNHFIQGNLRSWSIKMEWLCLKISSKKQEKKIFTWQYSSVESQIVISRYKYRCLQNDQHNRIFAIFIHLEPKIVSFKGIYMYILFNPKGRTRLKKLIQSNEGESEIINYTVTGIEYETWRVMRVEFSKQCLVCRLSFLHPIHLAGFTSWQIAAPPPRYSHCTPNKWACPQANSPTDWLTDRPTDQPSDWLTNWLIDWLTDRLIDWLTEFHHEIKLDATFPKPVVPHAENAQAKLSKLIIIHGSF